MIIGVFKEIKPNEYRVAAIPAIVKELVAYSHQVLVQKDAGVGSGFTDEEYAAAGATILDTADKGVKQALKEEDANLRKGLTACDGKLTLKETALKQNRVLTDADELVKTF